MNQIAAANRMKPPSGNAQVKPSDDLGDIPTFAWLPVDALVVDERYQRKITSDGIVAINKIVREFAWSKFQPLTVTGPDASGDYPVIDGQHRLEAARRHPLVTEVPCWVVQAPRISDQATTFVGVNRDRIRVTRVNIFWAELAAGDQTALWIKSICDRAGIKVGRVGSGVQPPLTTIALSTLVKLRALGDDLIVRALSALVQAQPEVDNAFRSATIIALTKLIGLNAALIDQDRLVGKLADLDLDQLIEKARAIRQGLGGNTEEALRILLVREYNARLPVDRHLREK